MLIRAVLFFLFGFALFPHSAAADGYGPVRSGDSLWKIAAQVNTPPDSELSRQQIMLALLRHNPHAFQSPCNVNSLKLGAYLQLPSPAQIAQTSKTEAIALLAEQERARREQDGKIHCPGELASSPVPATLAEPEHPSAMQNQQDAMTGSESSAAPSASSPMPAQSVEPADNKEIQVPHLPARKPAARVEAKADTAPQFWRQQPVILAALGLALFAVVWLLIRLRRRLYAHFRLSLYLLLSLLFALLALVMYRAFWVESAPPLHIALIAPLSGESESAGLAHLQGAQLYVEQLNQTGGIHGQPVELIRRDDRNNPEQGRAQAQSVATQTEALGVVGHNYSSVSQRAGEVYRIYGLPAVTPSSTDPQITQDNPWYFRVVTHNDFQGRFIAHYLKDVLGYRKVSLIYKDDNSYSKHLADVFLETAQDIGLQVKRSWPFQGKDRFLDDTLRRITGEFVEQKTQDEALFLSMHAAEGSKLVYLLKESGVQNQIIGPNAFATKAFQDDFRVYPKSAQNPGYYSDGILVATPLIFDTANEYAQHFRQSYLERYGEPPGWHAAYSFDAARMLGEALGQAGISGMPSTVGEDRAKIRAWLAAITTPETAVDSVTGLNYFDSQGNARKSLTVGVYKEGHLISALYQLRTSRSSSSQQARPIEQQWIEIDGQRMDKINVVYVGVQMNKISHIDPLLNTAKLDFYLWFRYQGDIKADDIEFLNAAEPVHLGEPLEVALQGNEEYRLYRASGLFKLNFLAQQRQYGNLLSGIRFINRKLGRDKLLYVSDELGMGVNEKQSLKQRLKDEQVLSDGNDWVINSAGVFLDNIAKASLGNPSYLDDASGEIEHSRFNFSVALQQTQFSLRDLIPVNITYTLIAFSLILLILSGFIARLCRTLSGLRKPLWFTQLTLTLLLLLSLEVLFIQFISPLLERKMQEMGIIGFEILWWLAIAWFISRAIESFFWQPLEQSAGRPIPNVVRLFVASLLYLLAIFGVIAFVFDQKITSLLATSGVVAMIIGLAIQINISNLFSGIAINIEHPFRIGDWIQLKDQREGKVVDITWRTTRLQTREATIITIPNSMAAESVVENFHYPDDHYWLWFKLYIEPHHLPAQVQKIIIDAMLSLPFVERDRAPFVRYRIDEWAYVYMPTCRVKDYGQHSNYLDRLHERLWLHLHQAGIQPALKGRHIDLFWERRAKQEELGSSRHLPAAWEQTPLFACIPETEAAQLAQRLPAQTLRKGARLSLTEQSETALWVIAEGVLSLRDKNQHPAADLSLGECFGPPPSEVISAPQLYAEALSDCRLLTLDFAAFNELAVHYPAFAERVAQTLARHYSAPPSAAKEIAEEEEGLFQPLRSWLERVFN